MRYLAMGDALCAEAGAPFMAPGSIQRHVRLAEESFKQRIRMQVLARPEYDLARMAELVEDRRAEEYIRESDIIVLSFGHKDLTNTMELYKKEQKEEVWTESLKECKSHIQKISGRIEELKGDKRYTAIWILTHNLYREDSHAEKWLKGCHKHLCCTINPSFHQVIYMDEWLGEKGNDWLTRDGLYLNRYGHEEMAKALHAKGYGPLLEKESAEKADNSSS